MFCDIKEVNDVLCGLLSARLTCLPVVALHVDTENRNPLPLHVVVIEINVRDGDVPG